MAKESFKKAKANSTRAKVVGNGKNTLLKVGLGTAAVLGTTYTLHRSNKKKQQKEFTSNHEVTINLEKTEEKRYSNTTYVLKRKNYTLAIGATLGKAAKAGSQLWSNMGTMGKIGTVAAGTAATGLAVKGLKNKNREE